MPRFFGKYRGQIVNNIDPQNQGRVQVSVPAVLGSGSLSWAMPCAPYGGAGVGFFAVPPIGANVWVEFEAGDSDYPIWAGCFWGVGDAPVLPAIPTSKVLKTDTAAITIDDIPGAGGILIEYVTGAKIVINATGIEIDNGMGGKIALSGPNVSVNNGALEVT